MTAFSNKVNQRPFGSFITIAGESHTIAIAPVLTPNPPGGMQPGIPAYFIKLNEIPGAPPNYTVLIPGYTEVVNTPPSAFQFSVDYSAGYISFNSIAIGITVSVTYTGTGSIVDAQDINTIQDAINTFTGTEIQADSNPLISGSIKLASGSGISLVQIGQIITISDSGITSSDINITNDHILIGNASNQAAEVIVSGDATLSNVGVLTLDTVNSDVGTFGDSTHVGQFTANDKGLVTSAGNVTISGTTPGGSAGGDLGGSYPNPTVAKINGVLLGTTTATDKNILMADGVDWESVPISGDLTVTADTGTFTLNTVNSNPGTFGDDSHIAQVVVNNKGLATSVSNITITGTVPGGSAGGDLSGSYPNPIVAKINTNTLGNTGVTNANVLIADGTKWNSEPISQDITITNAGVVTIQSNVVSNSKLAQMSAFTAKANTTSSLANASDVGVTSSNVSSNLVMRDASGNFSAGTITASLSGTATKADALNSTTTVVNVSSAVAPEPGQILTATTPSAAVWADPIIGVTGSGITQLTGDVTAASTPATYGSSVSGASPATTNIIGTLTINVQGDGAQTITLAANLTGASIAADIQAKVRNLTANTLANQDAFLFFTSVYTTVYTLTSGLSSASSSIVISGGTLAAPLKLGVANGGTEVSGANAITVVPATLATVNSNVGSFGTATQVGSFTVNAKGLITAASNTSITGLSPGVINLASAHLLVGNGSNVATDVALSGDVSILNTGASTVNKVDGVSYPASPSTNTVPVVTSSNTITYELVPVAAGGTGTSTQFTQGSIVFAGASGVYSQDNSKFFWNDSSGVLSVHSAAAGSQLILDGTGGNQSGILYETSGAVTAQTFSSASNDFSIYTNAGNTLGIYQTSAGNVGIKTTSVGNALVVNGTASATLFSGPLTGDVTGNCSGTSANVTGTVTVAHGGTGDTTLTAHSVLLGEGTGTVAFAGPSSVTSSVLMSNGLSTDPSFLPLNQGTGLTLATGSGGITFSLSTPVSVANGGTGTSTAFTAGSVVFAGASGTYSQDNSKLFWDDTNTFLGIGTATNPFGLFAATIKNKSGGQYALQLENNDWVQSTTGSVMYFGFGATSGNTYGLIATAIAGNSTAGDLVLGGAGGNVGIHTGVPAWPFTVFGASQFGSSASAAGLRYQTSGSIFRFDGINSDNNAFNSLEFYASGTIGLDINTNGNVGIGTTSPQSQLQVSGTIRTTNQSGNPTSGSGVELFWDGSEGILTAYDRTGVAQLRMDVNGNPLTLNSGGQGNVGIGNTSPSSLLSVGSSSQFQVDSSGNVVKLNNVTQSWPSSQGAANTALTNDGSGNLSWTAPNNQFTTTPTIQVFTSGSGTYTTPANTKWFRVREKGGGGGGAANDTNTGTNGGNTSFNSITANGGIAGVTGSTGADGAGGTGGAGSASIRITGTKGALRPRTFNSDGIPGPANSGIGGSGGIFSGNASGSGGDGEYAEFIVSSPSVTYSYAVGAGGSGGSVSNQAGGAGGSGIIIIEEHYNY